MNRGSPSRPKSFADPNAENLGGPGQYDTGYKMGDDAKPFTMGQRRPERVDESPGPGTYNE